MLSYARQQQHQQQHQEGLHQAAHCELFCRLRTVLLISGTVYRTVLSLLCSMQLHCSLLQACKPAAVLNLEVCWLSFSLNVLLSYCPAVRLK